METTPAYPDICFAIDDFDSTFDAFCIFYLLVADKGVSLTSTYPQLRSGNQTYIVLLEMNVG